MKSGTRFFEPGFRRPGESLQYRIEVCRAAMLRRMAQEVTDLGERATASLRGFAAGRVALLEARRDFGAFLVSVSLGRAAISAEGTPPSLAEEVTDAFKKSIGKVADNMDALEKLGFPPAVAVNVDRDQHAGKMMLH